MLEKLFSLKGKTALVTGGAGGLGSAQSRALAGAGASVAVCDLKAENCSSLVDELERTGVRAEAFSLDISDEKSVQETVEAVLTRFGQVNILCNTAGINHRVPILEFSADAWDKVLNVNLKGAFLMSRAIAPHMIAQGAGKVINMSSIMGRITYYNQAAYSASKGGLDALTRVMALEWAQHGIQVNAISPTYINTPLVEQVLKEEPERLEYIKRRTPMARLGKAEELMGLTIFLASPASDLMTGQSICIDGGWTVF